MTSSALSSADVLKLFQQYVIPNYGRYPVALTHGEGSYVWDAEGNRYLDLFPGWGCGLLGHCPGPVVEAVREQLGLPDPRAQHLVHGSPGAVGEGPFGTRVSAARRFSATREPRPTRRPSSSCGCTARPSAATRSSPSKAASTAARWARSTATAQPKYHEGLGPLVAGFVYAPFGDLDAVARLIDDETAAIMIEPIQGEGGVRIPPDGFLAGLRKLADEHDLLLVFDEVQTGFGRTGHWFAYQDVGRDARHHDPFQGAVRRHRRGGHARHAADRAQPAAGHARGHLRRQSDRRPRGHCRHRDDREAEPAGGRPAFGRDLPAAAFRAATASATWSARSASAA